MVKIDGIRYKADTWYTIKDGKIVEEKEDDWKVRKHLPVFIFIVLN